MNYLNILFWASLIGLFLTFIIYRFLPQSAIRSKLRYVFAVLLISGIGLGITKYLANDNIVSDSCPLEITPDEFADMTNKNGDYISGIFYNHKFETEQIEYKSEGKELIRYEYYNKKDKYYSTPELNAKYKNYNWAAYNQEEEAVLFIVKSSEDYEKFFKYLEQIGGTQLNSENFDNYQKIFDSKKSWKYKNSIIIKFGYIADNYGYTIAVQNYDSLKSYSSNSHNRADSGNKSK